jgi:hypothetical protein
MHHTVEEIRLKNGARGLFIDVPDATVMSMQFHFRAGNRFARSNDIEQVAHLMEPTTMHTPLTFRWYTRPTVLILSGIVS